MFRTVGGQMGDKGRTGVDLCYIGAMSELGLYQELGQEIDKAREGKYNLIVVSVPGMGGSHWLRKYASEHADVTYIGRAGMKLGKFNIIDLAMDLDEGATRVVEDYGRALGVDQKIVVLVNTPYWLRSSEYQNGYLRGHVYKTFWLRVLDKNEMKETMGGDGEVYEKSGGLPQIVKCLLAGGDEEVMRGIVEPIMRVAEKCSNEELIKLGLKNEDGWISQVLRSYTAEGGTGVKIDFDLTVIEDGQAGEKLTAMEAKILRRMVDEDGKVTKEVVSDIKWGEGKYDEFSDQAINKTMRRLSGKLRIYEVETIPKIGFRLKKR